MAIATPTDTFFRELEWRGFLDAVTSDHMEAFLAESRRTMYVGFDPTASSLHLGSLIPVMALAHAQRHGHRPLALVSGGGCICGATTPCSTIGVASSPFELPSSWLSTRPSLENCLLVDLERWQRVLELSLEGHSLCNSRLA